MRIISLSLLLAVASSGFAQDAKAEADLFIRAIPSKQGMPTDLKQMASRALKASDAGNWKTAIQIHEKIHRRVYGHDADGGDVVAIRNGNTVRLMSVNLLVAEREEAPWEYRAAIGWLYLYDLQRDKAVSEFNRLWKGLATPERYRGSTTLIAAAEGLSRAAAMGGDYKEAVKWYDLANKERLPFCRVHTGTDADSYPDIERLVLASLSKTNAPMSLLRLFEKGAYKPRQRFKSASTAKSVTADVARYARFLLAEGMRRLGDPETAKPLFSAIAADAKAAPQWRLMSRTYLRQ